MKTRLMLIYPCEPCDKSVAFGRRELESMILTGVGVFNVAVHRVSFLLVD